MVSWSHNGNSCISCRMRQPHIFENGTTLIVKLIMDSEYAVLPRKMYNGVRA